MILEGSRGCSHRCSFCTQWKHWSGAWRTKSARRIADEMEYLNERFGGEFLWLTDDNFKYNIRARGLKMQITHTMIRLMRLCLLKHYQDIRYRKNFTTAIELFMVLSQETFQDYFRKMKLKEE